MGTIGNARITVTNGFLADNPIFYPDLADPKKNHLSMNVIVNLGKTRAGVEMKATVSCTVWGKYANSAACLLRKGSCVNLIGDLQSFLVKTGVIGANGKEVQYQRTTMRVARYFFGGETTKDQLDKMKANMAAILASGRAITIEDAPALVKVIKKTTYDYNHAVALQTGMFGNARVHVKGVGFLKPGAAPATVVAPASNDLAGKSSEELIAMQQILADELAKKTAAAAATVAVDAFAGAAKK